MDATSVPRDALVADVLGSRAPVALVAPAGYGKTTLLALAGRAAPGRIAWLTVGPDHDDPRRLLRDVCEAIGRASDEGHVARTAQPADVDAALFAWTFAGEDPPTLILDGIEAIRDERSVGIVSDLLAKVPERATALVASREALPEALVRVRAAGGLRILGPSELAFDRRETDLALRASGLRLVADRLDAIVERTAGWPVAVRLGMEWLRGGHGRTPDGLTGSAPPIAEYVRSEILGNCSTRDRRFLERASVLERSAPSLCDEALGVRGSWKTLERLMHAGVLFTDEDASGSWFRFHPLVRDVLATELDDRESDARADIASRAAAWCEGHDEPRSAVAYAMIGEDVDRVLRIATAQVQSMFQTGDGELAIAWFDWLRPRIPAVRFGGAAVLAVFSAALLGRGQEAERWVDTAQRISRRKAPKLDVPGAAESIEPWLALCRAVLCRDGIDRMAIDATEAAEGISPTSSWYPTARMYAATAEALGGSPDRADELLLEANEQLEHDGATNAALIGVSERAWIAIRRGDRDAADTLLERACAIRDASDLSRYTSAALTYALAARLAVWHADLPRARRELAAAQRFRPMMSHVVPWLSVQFLLELVHVQIAFADAPAVRALLREIDAIVQRRPDLGVLVGEIEDARAQAAGIRIASPGASSLTSAELRLLPLLRTHLPFPEIAASLFLSKHTVKTQAISIYRKFGVTSRSDAVTRAIELGLLEP
jgi:LuxR family maltose regulon positive regulatory protein